jgi:hypothetical protein
MEIKKEKNSIALETLLIQYLRKGLIVKKLAKWTL